ncbi:hypothetical protein B0O99DRAFT_639454 [Bisporella sp. PMI_857]|nr:hypothetical protein B0O99DRAFT_639454 [Bisporella sp. PMI_857]
MFSKAAYTKLAVWSQSSTFNGQIRWNSTQPPTSSSKPVSPHVGFYKTFTRPIAKVLLMATFTYQLAYWGWVYLEKEEIKLDKSAEVQSLEKQLADLTDGKRNTP